jgi:two-component system, NtrC family, response regulator AtoC
MHSLSHKNCAPIAQTCADVSPTLELGDIVRTEIGGCTMNVRACTILIADDDKYVRDDLKDLLQSDGHTLLFAATAKETLDRIQESIPDLVLLDLKFPDCDDLRILQRIKRDLPQTEVIMLTSQTEDLTQVVAAIKSGAFDYVGKPFEPEELRNRVYRALELRSLSKSQDRLLKEIEVLGSLDALVGNSSLMLLVRETITRFADLDGCVLVNGESGTGKELVARSLHYCSRRRSRPFVTVNCASIPATLVESVLFGHRKGAFTGAVENSRGKFDVVEDGTLFLDEIGDMPLEQQAALLRVLEYRTFTPIGEFKERQCKARFVFATNKDLRQLVKDGLFREDLYYRIKVASVAMPALQHRTEDIPALVGYYANKLSAEMGRNVIKVREDVMALFKRYDWPGNVRELKHVLEGAIMLLPVTRDEIALQDLPSDILASSRKENGASLTSSECREKEELILALKQCLGNQTQVAKMLGVHRNTIRSRIRYYGLAGSEF